MTPIGVHLCSSVVSFILLVAAPLLCVLRVPVVKRVPIGFVDSGSGAALYSSGCPRECISYEHAMVCYRSHHRIFASTLLDPERVCVRRRGAGLLRKENPGTLVVWGGEFGRTPTAQLPDDGYVKEVGRDHNPFGFTMWLAGGGIKGGTIYGETDEYGYFAIKDKVHVHDLHATILHLLGLDHTKLTYRFSGRDMRLTDVHGNIVREILA